MKRPLEQSRQQFGRGSNGGHWHRTGAAGHRLTWLLKSLRRRQSQATIPSRMGEVVPGREAINKGHRIFKSRQRSQATRGGERKSDMRGKARQRSQAPNIQTREKRKKKRARVNTSCSRTTMSSSTASTIGPSSDSSRARARGRRLRHGHAGAHNLTQQKVSSLTNLIAS